MLTKYSQISIITNGNIFQEGESLRVMKKYDKSSVMQISQVFGTL